MINYILHIFYHNKNILWIQKKVFGEKNGNFSLIFNSCLCLKQFKTNILFPVLLISKIEIVVYMLNN